MTLYETLEHAQQATSFPTSSEAVFYNEHAYLLSDDELFARFLKPADSFMTIRGNIILRAILNKKTIERLFKSYSKEEKSDGEEPLSLEEYMADGMSNLPYLLYQGQKIYVPIFPASLNALYAGDFAKLASSPYKNLITAYQAACVDPFDYYGYALYDSYFTRLVPIRKNAKALACYDYDAEALYFIDEQGRLDAKICFFDRGLEKPVKTHMVKRIERVADAYLANDRSGLLKALLEGNLVSAKLIHQLSGDESQEPAGE